MSPVHLSVKKAESYPAVCLSLIENISVDLGDDFIQVQSRNMYMTVSQAKVGVSHQSYQLWLGLCSIKA